MTGALLVAGVLASVYSPSPRARARFLFWADIGTRDTVVPPCASTA